MHSSQDTTAGRRVRETERCPNCGELYFLGECNHSSSITTSWGGSTLYGVCKICAAIHESMNRKLLDEEY